MSDKKNGLSSGAQSVGDFFLDLYDFIADLGIGWVILVIVVILWYVIQFHTGFRLLTIHK